MMIKRTLNSPISIGSGVIIAAVKDFEEIVQDAEFTGVGDHGVYRRTHSAVFLSTILLFGLFMVGPTMGTSLDSNVRLQSTIPAAWIQCWWHSSSQSSPLTLPSPWLADGPPV